MLPLLEQTEGITVFAPNEEAFNNVKQMVGVGGGLGIGNVTLLSIVLGNHVSDAFVTSICGL